MNIYLNIIITFAAGLACESGQIQQTPELKNSADLAKSTPTSKQDAKLTETTSKKPPAIEVALIAERPPSAEKVPGKPGYVFSPFSAGHRIIDVTHLPPGTKVKCPYTMKIFRVP